MYALWSHDASVIGMARYRWLVPVACGHGIADLVAGWMLMTLAGQLSAGNAAAAFVLYNGIAFGGQVLCAGVVDGRRAKAVVAAGGLVCLALGVVMMPFAVWGALVAAGCGSAMFHVAGGAMALTVARGGTTAAAMFTAPGAAGLAVGAWLGTTDTPAGPMLVVVLTGLAVWVVRERAGTVDEHESATHGVMEPDADTPVLVYRYQLLLILLLVAVAARSAVWTAVQYAPGLTGRDLVALGLCASFGKAVGGVLPDRVGAMRWTLVSCIVSAVLFSMGTSPLTVLPGVVLLQSTVPSALVAAGHLLPARPGLAAGLVLGLAVTIGGLGAGGAAALQSAPAMLFLILAILAGVTVTLFRRMEPVSRSPVSQVPLLSLALLVFFAAPLSADIVGPGPVGSGSATLLGTIAAIAGAIGAAVLAWMRRRRK